MYLVVIMAFAFVLSDDLPPQRLCLLAGPPWPNGTPLVGMIAIVLGQVLAVGLVAAYCSRVALLRLDNSPEAHDRTTSTFATGQRILIGVIAAALIGTMVFTPWIPLVRGAPLLRGLDFRDLPLLPDLLILAPFLASLAVAWTIFYRVELRIRAALPPEPVGTDLPPGGDEPLKAVADHFTARQSRPSPDAALGTYLLDKFRHHVLIIAAPMGAVVFAKYFTDLYKDDLRRATSLPWAADSILGAVSICVLALAPVMLRYIWSTEPLPHGLVRERFERTCRRIGLRYREILLWHTHGMAVNAAVMGFAAPLRYILVSDALLDTMNEEETEAVFGHEAGHVRHWHLQYFVLFALLSMYIAGGVLELLWTTRLLTDMSLLQLIALGVLLLVWLFGFGWLSQRFERQADLFAIRCVTPDIKTCTERCPVHGATRGRGLCVAAANLFGRTLCKIADLNGIPRDAPTWRHGSIDSRCRLVEELASDPAALRRFDRTLFWLKLGLIVASAVGTLIAALIYGEQIWRAVNIRLLRG